MLRSSLHRRPARKALIRKLAVLSAASTALFAAPAQAQDQERWLAGVGVFVGVAFGSRVGFQWGGEVFTTHLFREEHCGDNFARSGLGPMFQVAVINLDSARLTLGLQGGGEFARNGGALSGELGGTVYFGKKQGFDLHTGFTLIEGIFTLSGRAQWFQQEYAATFGARDVASRTLLGPNFTYGGTAECIVGRPLRTANGVTCFDRHLPLSRDRHARATDTDDDAYTAGLDWQRAAKYECASVPAFLQLAAELLAHDAPDALVEAALKAAEDEMRHARVSAELASRLLGARVWPELPDVPPRAPLAGRAGLIRLSTESWLDGCLTEGMAAERARRASRLAVDREARSTQDMIARDEARHAELGWDILRWAMQAGGDDARDAVRSLRDGDVSAADGEEATVARYGCLGAREIDEVSERHAALSRRRLDALL